MDKQFWIKAWEEKRIAFHKENFHPKLLQFFSLLSATEGERVFVPLCGKTHDMLWLLQQGLVVHGVELSDIAVKEFFLENNLPAPVVESDKNFIHFRLENIEISCGDFFAVPESNPYDMVFDRASLVALPREMRKDYAQKIGRLLKPAGRCLLITYQYQENEMSGPPFSISDREINELYAECFSIQELESLKPVSEGNRLDTVPSLKQKVYLLTKHTR